MTREAGAGSVDELPSGRFRARLTLDSGRRGTLGVFASQAEAEGALNAALSKLADASMAPVGGQTLSAYGRAWLARRELAGVRAVRTDINRWAQHIDGAPIASLALKAITRRDVMEWAEELRRKPAADRYPGARGPRRLARQTVVNTLNLLRVALRDAVERDLLKANPARDVRIPKEGRTDDPWTYLTPDEQVALVNAVPAPEAYLVAFSIGTGLRQGELRSLLLPDVHVDAADPHVVVRYGSPGKPTKSKRIRHVQLFGLALRALRAWLVQLPGYARRNPQRIVFPTRSGTYRQEGHMLPPKWWEAALARAGIARRVRWHDLRHTCASSLVAGWFEGGPWRLEEVREMLGHSSITVTERYAHMADTVLKAAARRMRMAEVTPRSLPAQVPDTTEEASGFLNRRFGSSTLPGGATNDSAEVTEKQKPPGEARRDLRVTARMFLAAAAGVDQRAHELAVDLAEGVLDVAEVALALEVLDGGDATIARATQLAERILGASVASLASDLAGGAS